MTQEEEEKKSRGLGEDAEGRKTAASLEEKDEDARGKKDAQEKFNKLFSQPSDPWASSGRLEATRCYWTF